MHFFKKSRMAEHYEFWPFTNFRIILEEESADDLFKAASRADIFIYQPTPAVRYCELSTEEMLSSVVPAGALKLSFAYAFNHGFYPLVLHGLWRTGKAVLNLALRDPVALLAAYDNGSLSFDCPGRFIDCLAEQRRREETMDVKMADFSLSTYRSQQLFICENHPASAYFAELARRFLLRIEPAWAENFSFEGPNDVNLPTGGGMLVSPQAVQELGLSYTPEDGAVAFYRGKLEQLVEWAKEEQKRQTTITATNL